MADLPAPSASRLQRPSWKDGRLVVGVLLVLVAVVAGGRAMAAADDTVPVFAAAHVLVPGQRVGAGDVRSVQVHLDDLTSAYVDAKAPLEPDTYVLREVRSGELVPRTALGSEKDVRAKAVTLPVEPSAAGSLVRGSVVDVWLNTPQGNGASAEFGDPVKALSAAVVARVPGEQSRLAIGSSKGAIQVMVPEDQVQSIIAAVDGGAKVTLVPTAGSPLQDPP